MAKKSKRKQSLPTHPTPELQLTHFDHTLQTIMAYLFYACIIIVPLTWTAKTSELFEFPKMLLVYVFASLIATIWVTRSLIHRRFIIRRTYLTIPLLLFLASQVISTIFSIDPHTSLFGYYSRFHGGLLSTISYLILYFAAVSNLSSSQGKHLLYSFLIAGTLSSLYALPEHFGASASCALITGKFDVACWVQDVQTRVFGTFGQPNWLAAYIISIIFIPLAYLTNSLASLKTGLSPANATQKSKSLIIAHYLLIILLFLVLLFTKSRSGLLGLAIGFAIFIPASLFRSPTRHAFAKPLSLTLLVLATCFLFLGRGLIPQVDRLINQFTPPQTTQTPTADNPPPLPNIGTQLETGGTESGTIRRIVWSGALELFKRHPLFGTGVETYAFAYYQVRPVAHNLVSEWDFLYNKAHNEWLNFLSTSGLFGLGSYLIIIFTYAIWTIRQVLRFNQDRSKAVEPNPLSHIALLAGFLSLAVSNFLGFSTVPVGLVFFLFPAIAHLLTAPASAKTPTHTISNAQYIGISLAFIACVFALVAVSKFYRADVAYATSNAYLSKTDLLSSMRALESAIKLFPSEPTYTDKLSFTMSQAAVALYQHDQKDQGLTLKDQAIKLSDYTLIHNAVNPNFYKTRARMFIQLTSIDRTYLADAEETLKAAITLSPTDPKLHHNLGLIYLELGDYDQALDLFQTSVRLKPDYQDARVGLATLYENQSEYALASAQYKYILEHINPQDGVSIEKLSKLATQSANIDPK